MLDALAPLVAFGALAGYFGRAHRRRCRGRPGQPYLLDERGTIRWLYRPESYRVRALVRLTSFGFASLRARFARSRAGREGGFAPCRLAIGC